MNSGCNRHNWHGGIVGTEGTVGILGIVGIKSVSESRWHSGCRGCIGHNLEDVSLVALGIHWYLQQPLFGRIPKWNSFTL